MDKLDQYYNLDNLQEHFPQKITAIHCGDDVYYLKRRIEDKYWSKRALKIIQKCIVAIFGLREFAPTVNVRHASSYEPKKIVDLDKKGISVPKVFFYNDQYFIMSDCGETLQSYIKHHPEEADRLLLKAIDQLAKLHNSGNAHGGSQIRNFAVKNGRVTMFDFEEIIPEKYCENIQFRDILIFLISLTRLKNVEFNYRDILQVYEDTSEIKGRAQKVVALAKRFNWLGRFSQTAFARLFGRDIYRISLLVRQLLLADAKTPIA